MFRRTSRWNIIKEAAENYADWLNGIWTSSMYQEPPTTKLGPNISPKNPIFCDFAKYSAINEFSFHHRNSAILPKHFQPNIWLSFGPKPILVTHWARYLHLASFSIIWLPDSISPNFSTFSTCFQLINKIACRYPHLSPLECATFLYST